MQKRGCDRNAVADGPIPRQSRSQSTDIPFAEVPLPMPEPADVHFLSDRFRILRELGRGGYGVVYLAEELGSGAVFEELSREGDGDPVALRKVALKVFHDDVEPRRVQAELRALCRLNHPNVVTVYHHGCSPHPWLAMEHVDGEPLSMRMGAVALARVTETVRLLIAVADGLGHAHERGVVHRDLKPHNILVEEGGRARVVDFGLSWMLQSERGATQRVGTPGYLAPELLDGDGLTCDHRADLYSLGATIFAVFAGEGPFSAPGLFATVRRQLAGSFEFPESFPEPLRELVQRCLSTDPFDRPRTAEQVAEELRRIVWKLAATSMAGAARVRAHDTRTDLREAVVRDVERIVHPERGECVRLRAVDGEAPAAPAMGVFAWATGSPADRRTHDTLSRLWEGAEVSLFGGRALTRSGEGFVLADGETVPVIEPGFPVSVTEVARVDGVRAAPCATRLLVAMREPRAREHYLVEGSLAHRILEHLMLGTGSERPDFGTAFERALAESRLELLAAGFGDVDLPELRDRMHAHFTFLAPWTERARAAGARAAEARRLSGRYGLEGRIDLALVDEQRLHIVELKTGRRETTEHEQQLRCYTLLWDEAAQALGRHVEGTLLYSKTGREKSLRRGSHAEERRVLAARNDIVALHRHFSDSDTSYRPPSWMQQPELCSDAPCRWLRDECRRQTAVLGSQCGTAGELGASSEMWGDTPAPLIRAARAWYFHFVRLIEREYRAASMAMGRLLRPESLADRVGAGDAVEGAEVISVDAERSRVVFRVPRLARVHEGDRLLAHRGAVDDAPTLHGIVREVSGTLVTLAGDGAGLVELLPEQGWFLEREPARIGFRDMHVALYRALLSPQRGLLDLLVRPHVHERLGQISLLERERDDSLGSAEMAHAGGLNARQEAAIERALEAERGFLIQGPPGTGKTTVIAELVRRLVARGKRVLLAAHTNTAVDTMLARVVLAGVTDVLRVGHAVSAGRELVAALEGAGREPETHFSDTLARRAASLGRLSGRLRDVPVVAATTHACVRHVVFDILERGAETDGAPHGTAPLFDVVIVDEASQLTEPLAVGALLRGRRFILVGDDCQLPPVVSAADALSTAVRSEVPEELREAGVSGLERSLFERLRPFLPGVMLEEQYRMNDGVQAVPSRLFYEGRLRPAGGVAERRLPVSRDALESLSGELRRRLDPERPLVWVDPGGDEDGHCNRDEVEAVVETAVALASLSRAETGCPDDWIGVVAPFRAQCHAIRAALQERLGRDLARRIEVDTVERFQGREKEAMLVSLVTREWNDFVFDRRRMNVTLTRARSKVVVFGHRGLGRRMLESWDEDRGS